MARNDLGKRCVIRTAAELVRHFSRARHHGYDMEMSARFAIMELERTMWHSRYQNNIDLYGSSWHTNDRIDCSLKRFMSLINSPFQTDITAKELKELGEPWKDYEKPISYMNDILLIMADKILDGKNKSAELLRRAVKNYKRVTGIKNLKHSVILELVGAYNPVGSITNPTLYGPKIYIEWIKIKRGRDLFVFGRFDIKETVRSLNFGWALATYNIQGEAYGIPAHYMSSLLKPEHEDKLNYVKRYIQWFRQDNNVARVDELFSRYMDLNLPPDTALRRVEELLREEDRLFDERYHLDDDEEENYEPEHSYYNWVSEQFPPIETKIGILKPIDTREELLVVADQMRNCAANYTRAIQDKETLLVVLIQDNRYKALCQYNRKGELLQCFGPCNRKVDKEVMKIFKKFKPKW